MREPRMINPWLAALISWAAATAVISVCYVTWRLVIKQPIHWDLLQKASLIVIPIALYRAWRDSRAPKG
jgi:hypothetical protein